MSQWWRLIGFGSVLLLLLAFTQQDVVGQKKDKKAKAKDTYPVATPEDYTKLKGQGFGGQPGRPGHREQNVDRACGLPTHGTQPQVQATQGSESSQERQGADA